ncbi:MAG: hypothetical protein U9R75_12535, partial [Candidatus Thermoplasmatota archaeon]|nr:hypothetical protein [Candidatus Thermoplasmatota archaeon]
EWFLASGTNSWGYTLIAEGTDQIQQDIPLQARSFDGIEYCYAYVNITIMNIPPKIDLDYDDDGVPNSKDAFKWDPSEWKDSDGDGMGDNSDPFPYNKEWTEDSDKDGIADLAEDEVYRSDPENRPLSKIHDPDDGGNKYNLMIPVLLGIISLVILAVMVFSILGYTSKRNASRDPKKMARYNAKQQRSRERRHEFIEKLPMAKIMDRVVEMIGGGGAKPSSSFPTPSQIGGPTPTMVRSPMNIQRPGIQQINQRQLPPMMPQQINRK